MRKHAVAEDGMKNTRVIRRLSATGGASTKSYRELAKQAKHKANSDHTKKKKKSPSGCISSKTLDLHSDHPSFQPTLLFPPITTSEKLENLSPLSLEFFVYVHIERETWGKRGSYMVHTQWKALVFML